MENEKSDNFDGEGGRHRGASEETGLNMRRNVVSRPNESTEVVDADTRGSSLNREDTDDSRKRRRLNNDVVSGLSASETAPRRPRSIAMPPPYALLNSPRASLIPFQNESHFLTSMGREPPLTLRSGAYTSASSRMMPLVNQQEAEAYANAGFLASGGVLPESSLSASVGLGPTSTLLPPVAGYPPLSILLPETNDVAAALSSSYSLMPQVLDPVMLLRQRQLLARAGRTPLVNYPVNPGVGLQSSQHSATAALQDALGSLYADPRAASLYADPTQWIIDAYAEETLIRAQRDRQEPPSGSPQEGNSRRYSHQESPEESGLVPSADVVGSVKHFSDRVILPLSTDEDENWLSELLCFVRSDLIEVFRAGELDVASRSNSKKIGLGQVGIRCRFCAHVSHGNRVCRSSSFPSSMSRIYQSLTMMLRDHFPRCQAIPEKEKKKFLSLKSKTSQGATDSKRYWIDSAKKLGMVDTPQGIFITESARKAALTAPPFGTSEAKDTGPPVLLVKPEDKEYISEYMYLLLSQVQRVFLSESELVGNRRFLKLGLPGFGCLHCCPISRKGMCRLYPARRRALPSKVNDIYDHLRRCSRCPEEVKQKLRDLKPDTNSSEKPAVDENLRRFFDAVWERLYKDSDMAGNRDHARGTHSDGGEEAPSR